ncbi:unnamed protein product [Notodromas monacha]|uniref:Acireductone dioxygenase n=1 Tax=Notodromas monacha TaxID=399045 RepID=A0A7R9GH10_9CRUS|nr:unnamed protein product [Notodromas monacha]CAG0920429.1 unnamed protein product [Notodromas monacha]
MRAWYMADIETATDKDPRLEHALIPPQPVAESDLKTIGVLYWKLDPQNFDEDLDRIRVQRNYSYMDEIRIEPDSLENYEEKLKVFFSEHFHRDEEIRFVLAGSGYFDVRDKEDKWIRILVEAGDLIVLPAGIHHRFTMDTKNCILVKRLFVGEPVWLAIGRPEENDLARVTYRERLKAGFLEKKIPMTNSVFSDFTGPAGCKIGIMDKEWDESMRIVAVDNMVRMVAAGQDPLLPEDYKAKILGLSTRTASSHPISLNVEPKFEQILVPHKSKTFDPVQHLIEWHRIVVNEHPGIVIRSS